jgi:hypothetical protein
VLRGWSFGAHARDHINARGFDPHSVVEACTSPEITVTAENYGPGRVRYVKGDLVVIAIPESRQVVTALLRSHHEWCDEDALRISGATA